MVEDSSHVIISGRNQPHYFKTDSFSISVLYTPWYRFWSPTQQKIFLVLCHLGCLSPVTVTVSTYMTDLRDRTVGSLGNNSAYTSKLSLCILWVRGTDFYLFCYCKRSFRVTSLFPCHITDRLTPYSPLILIIIYHNYFSIPQTEMGHIYQST